MIYHRRPENFDSRFEIVSCFFEYAGEILLLHRQDYKPEGDTWGVPAGKVNEGESLVEAMIREAREETGEELSEKELVYFKKIFVKYPGYDFVYHIFHIELKRKAEISISKKEHKEFRWVNPIKALDMNLIGELNSCIKLYYKKTL